CLHLALSDKSEKVRRAAGKSFALLAPDNEQLEVLKHSFHKSETRRYALEILADMHLAGRPITSFKWFLRRRGRRTAEKRAKKEHFFAIRERGKTGALTGLLAGLAWTLTVGLGLTWLVSCVFGPEWPWIQSVFIPMGMALPIALGFGAWYGYTNSLKVAKAAAMGNEDKWSRTLLRPGLYFWFLLLYFIILSSIAMNFLAKKTNLIYWKDQFPLYWKYLYPLLIFFTGFLCAYIVLRLFYTLLAGLIWASRPCVWPGVKKLGVWFWSFICCIGFPLFVPAMILVAHAQVLWPLKLINSKDFHELFFGSVIILAPFFSFLTFVLSVSLARSTDKTPISPTREPKLKKRWAARGLSVLAVLFLVSWFGILYGFDTIPLPFFASAIKPGQEIKLSSKLGPGLLDTDYYSVPSTSEYKVIDITNLNGEASLYIDGEEIQYNYYSNNTFLLGPWYQFIAVTFKKSRLYPRILVDPIDPNLRIKVSLTQDIESMASANLGAYFTENCCLKKQPDGDTKTEKPWKIIWEGSINRILAKDTGQDDLKISVFLPEMQLRSDKVGFSRGADLKVSPIYTKNNEVDPNIKSDILINIRFKDDIWPLNLGQPIGKVIPDDTGAWGLDLTLKPFKNDDTWSSQINDINIIVVFQLTS
ncbi:MAG: hypothetical protein ACFFCW_45530, partial [Candidatus Hodarchaeota archaeon]